MTKILIIEDEEAIASMYKFKLELAGYEAICVSNGVEGLKVAEEQLPNLIMLDLRMPLMNGELMLEKLRATEWGAGIPVIVLTNISRDEAPASMRLMRVQRYIVKAHNTPTQVSEIVKEVLSSLRKAD